MAIKIEKKGRYLNYRGLSHINLDWKPKVIESVKEFPKDGLLTAIFAPDPLTGMPSAAAMLTLQNGNLTPEQRELLRQKYCKPLPVDVGSMSADAALEYTKTQNERFDAYVNRLIVDIEKSKKSVE